LKSPPSSIFFDQKAILVGYGLKRATGGGGPPGYRLAVSPKCLHIE